MRFRTLSVMVGSWSSDELFAESYLELLEKVRAVNHPGTETQLGQSNERIGSMLNPNRLRTNG